jgi:MFS family permease
MSPIPIGAPKPGPSPAPDPPPACANPIGEASRRYRGWKVVVACFFLAMFSWGFGFYGHGIYLAELNRQHGWSRGLISTASTAYYFLGAVLVIYVSDAIRRFGPTAVALGGTIAMAGSAVLVGLVREPWQLFAAYLLMAAGWAGMTLATITNTLGLWFSEKRGLAISLALNGASSGGIVMVPVLVALIDWLGLAHGLMLAAAAMLVVMLPMTLAWIGRPGPDDGAPQAVTMAAAAPPAWTRARALGSLHFWTVAAPFALALMAQVGLLVHQIAFLESAIGRAQAGLAVAITSIMAVVGRVGLGTVIDRLDQRRATAISLASQALAVTILSLTSEPLLLLAACALFGFSVGNVITFPALIVGREFEAASFGMLMALVTAINQFAYSLGPAILGLVRDAMGGYMVPLWLCVAVQVLAAAIILMRPGTDGTGRVRERD